MSRTKRCVQRGGAAAARRQLAAKKRQLLEGKQVFETTSRKPGRDGAESSKANKVETLPPETNENLQQIEEATEMNVNTNAGAVGGFPRVENSEAMPLGEMSTTREQAGVKPLKKKKSKKNGKLLAKQAGALSPTKRAARDKADGSEAKKKKKSAKKLERLLAKQLEEPKTWQQKSKTVTDRDIGVMNNKQWADCIFIVGETRQRFPVHSVYMAKISSKFANMVYGQVVKVREIVSLPNVDPDVFSIIYKYAYTGTVDLSGSNYIQACDLLLVGKKFQLPDSMLDQVRGYLWMHMLPKHPWAIIDIENLEELLFSNAAWQAVRQNTVSYLNLPDFINLSFETIVFLIRKQSLNCTEVELFNAVERWTEAEVVRQKLPPGPASLQKIFDPLVAFFHFSLMTEEEFTTGPGQSDMLSTEHKECFSKHVKENALKKPYTRSGSKHHNFFVFAHPHDPITNVVNTTSGYFTKLSFNAFDTTIVGVLLPSQFKKNKTVSYNEDLTVYISNEDTDEVLVRSNFTSSVPYNSVMQVPILPPLRIEEVKTRLYVTVVFHKTGMYHDELDPTRLEVQNRANYFGYEKAEGLKRVGMEDLINGHYVIDVVSVKGKI